MNAGSRFPFRVLRGKQHEMVYLVAGFEETDFPPVLRGFPRVRFVAHGQISFIGQIPEEIQVGILSARLDADDLEWLSGQLRRAGIPQENIVIEKNPRLWTGWFHREFDIPRGSAIATLDEVPSVKLVVGVRPEAGRRTPANGHIVWWADAAEHDCSHLPMWTDAVFLSTGVGPIARREIEEEVARRGARLVDFDGEDDLMSYLRAEADQAAQQAMPKVLALGINREAAAEIVGNPLYRCYSVQETARLLSLPRQTQLVVMATRYSHPDTVLRMKQLAGEAGVKFVELVGGTNEFRRWLSRTNVEKELSAPGAFAATVGSSISTDLPAPPEGLEPGNGMAAWVPVPEMAPSENRGEQSMSNAAEGTVKDFIKRYWAETGGSPSQLLQKAKEVGRPTTLGSITGAKSALLRQDGWAPPARNGAKPRPLSSPEHKGRGNVIPAGDSAFERMQLGIAKIAEGLELIRQSAALTEGMESRLHVLEPLFAAVQAVSAQQSSKR